MILDLFKLEVKLLLLQVPNRTWTGMAIALAQAGAKSCSCGKKKLR